MRFRRERRAPPGGARPSRNSGARIAGQERHATDDHPALDDGEVDERQIALHLALSMRTVENHRANLMGKLGVASRVELVNYAEEHDLI